MAKRFTETKKWSDPWFRTLAPKYKLFWIFITENCSPAGIWNIDMESLRFHIGESYVADDLLKVFANRIERVREGYWFVTRFIEVQYGHLSETCKPHKRIIAELHEFGLFQRVSKGFVKGYQTLEEKEKEKDFRVGGVGEETFKPRPTPAALKKAGLL